MSVPFATQELAAHQTIRRYEESLNETLRQDDLQYRRLRSPAQNGATLESPPLDATEALWRRNLASFDSVPDIAIGSSSLKELRASGRAQLIEAATDYTRRYRDFDLMDRNSSHVIMSGHQPELFHPGVWFKNFALLSLAEQFRAIPINLVVDNDICTDTLLKLPRYHNGKATVDLISIDAPAAAVPYELRPVVDRDQFRSFADQVTKEIASVVPNPIVRKLWPHVLAALDLPITSTSGETLLGSVLAAGRHRLEADAGLQTLEIPVSRVAELTASQCFAASILLDQNHFNTIYNRRLFDYRRLHGIRSDSHPVPELETDGRWLESPFWIYQRSDPIRKRLFVASSGRQLQLTDRSGWNVEVETSNLEDALAELSAAGVFVRPRALMTTMFSRLMLSDLFLHGIGGAKYDQLTDLIAADFFGVTLPAYSTLSATFRLPFDETVTQGKTPGMLRNELRDLLYHPERHVSDPDSETQAIINRKQAAIEAIEAIEGTERHQIIESCNHQLREHLSKEIAEAEKALSASPALLRNQQILGSREYSFCLFPECLMGDLSAVAR